MAEAEIPMPATTITVHMLQLRSFMVHLSENSDGFFRIRDNVFDIWSLHPAQDGAVASHLERNVECSGFGQRKYADGRTESPKLFDKIAMCSFPPQRVGLARRDQVRAAAPRRNSSNDLG